MKNVLKYGCLSVCAVTLLIIGIGYFLARENHQDKEYNVLTDPVFSENIDCDKDFEDGNYSVRYEQLEKNLRKNTVINTSDKRIETRKSNTELHIFDLNENGIPVEATRVIHKIRFGGLATRRLLFGIVDKKNSSGSFILQFDSSINPEKVVIVKIRTPEYQYCKRGILVDVLE